MKNKKYSFFIFFFLLLSLFLGAGFVSALEIDYPGLPFPQNINPEQGLTRYFEYIFWLAFWIAAAIVAVSFMVGAVRYIFSNLPFFGGKAQAMASAKEQMTSALLGLLILIASITLLKTINPEIIVFKMPELEPHPDVEQADFPEDIKKPKSQINVELPFGTIIEKRIFENQETAPSEQKTRMERIKDTASNFLNTAADLKISSEYLRDLVINNCACNVLKIEDECVCDPCQTVRGNIQATEVYNLRLIGIEIQAQDSGEDPIPPFPINLISEQQKAVKEIRLLKEELSKLETSKRFLLDCGLEQLDSLAEHLTNKEYYQKNEWFLVRIKFWRKILLDLNRDHATFYCPVSGTFFGDLDILSQEMEEIPEDILNSDMPEPFIEPMACEEIPVGKFIDKAERLSKKLVERLETLIRSSKDLTKKIDELHILISQCTSQNCYIPEDNGGSDYEYDNTDSTDETLGSLVISPGEESSLECKGQACPVQAIINKTQEIIDIVEGIPQQIDPKKPKQKEGIRDIVDAPVSLLPKDQLQIKKTGQIGILQIIEDIIPQFLKDFRKKVIDKMETCVTDIDWETLEPDPDQPIKSLLTCSFASGAVAKGKRIDKCYLNLKELEKCLRQCYLEIKYQEQKPNENSYKKCLRNCLSKEADVEPDITETWYLYMDFFCCGG